ncbi:MAG: gamma-glutamyl-gamma-aminobutyrate hydrolase family protein [Planctomycetaceae bacterium]|jgi:putative glutamine amidotransferase|nr:gamma-glutamyl-gamma-aminobutyrate hydrolase family protein [Planctomycetaceae bacterium]
MSKKPIIGINGDFREARMDAGALSWFNAGYYDCVTASKIQTAGNNKARNCPGGLPIMIPPFEEAEDIEAIVDMIDGLVLSGCHLDLDLELAGHDPHPASRTMPSRREMFDRRLCELVVERKLPVLAVGSGMQLMNLICGGTILRHIPEDFEQPLQHRDPVEPNLRHLIEIEEDSMLFEIYGPGEIRVNSQHHMAVGMLAPEFRVSARTPDGVTEAFESIDPDWFCHGVQWHPENDTASRLDMQLFEAFVQACDDRRQGVPFVLPFPGAQKVAA